MDAVDETIGEHGEERREAFNCMDKGDRYFGGCRRGEDMPTYLEKGERESRVHDFTCRVPDPVLKSCNGGLKRRI